MKAPERIPIPELKTELESAKQIVLIDVREKNELAESGRIPGALHIPMGQIQKRMEDYEKDQPIVFY